MLSAAQVLYPSELSRQASGQVGWLLRGLLAVTSVGLAPTSRRQLQDTPASGYADRWNLNEQPIDINLNFSKYPLSNTRLKGLGQDPGDR